MRIFLRKTRARSPEQATSHAYWESCRNSFIANPEYYTKVDEALRHTVLPLLPSGGSLLDAGCGNGKYTSIMAPHFRRVDAFDVSRPLIEEARHSAADAGFGHVRFEIGDVADIGRGRRRYDVVTCTGVLSTIVDDWLVREIMAGLRKRLRSGGVLLLRDSLSTLPEGQLVVSEGYATKYHYDGWYHECLRGEGLRLRAEIPLATFGSCTNRFYLYEPDSVTE